MRIVIDTNILLGALFKRRENMLRKIIRYCLEGLIEPLVGNALFLEYEDVLARKNLISKCQLSKTEIDELFDAFLSCCEWVKIYYKWRPNLKDEGDNHLIELAVAGGAEYIITRNIKDLTSGELNFHQLKIITPNNFIKEVKLWEH
jgi:putative PIN family toxin of toxin-antitoxin system